MSTVINIKPDCLASLKGENSYELLDAILTIFNDGRKAVKILETVDYSESPDFIVDYSELFDLEDLLIEKETKYSGFGEIDAKDIVKYARNSFLYFNDACELLDVDSCSNTTMDCAEMLAKVNFAVANASTFLYNILFEFIKYVQYLINIKDEKLCEQTKLQYPEFEEVEVNFSPNILEILRRYGEPEEPESLTDFILELLNVVKEYPTQNTSILNYYSEYSEFYDLAERYSQVDIQDAVSITMPHDIKYLLSIIKNEGYLAESIFDQLGDKLNGRVGAIDGVQSMSYYGLDSLVWLAKYCVSDKDFEYLYKNERYLCSNLNKCYMCIARKSLDGISQSDDVLNTTNFF